MSVLNRSRTERSTAWVKCLAQDRDHNTIIMMITILFIQSFGHLLRSVINFYYIFQIICKSPGEELLHDISLPSVFNNPLFPTQSHNLWCHFQLNSSCLCTCSNKTTESTSPIILTWLQVCRVPVTSSRSLCSMFSYRTEIVVNRNSPDLVEHYQFCFHLF